MSKLERDDERTIKRWCKSVGILFIKFTPMGEKGWPDRIAILPEYGKTFWIELKRKGKKPTKLQDHRMAQLREKGAYAVWFDNAEDCINYLESEL